MYWRFFLFLAVFASASSQLYPQSEELVERTVCIFDPANHSENPDEVAWVGSLVADTLEVMLREAGYTVIEGQMRRRAAEEAGLSPEDFLDKQTALEFAAALGADVAANGMFRVEGQEIVIGVKAYDIFTERIAVAMTRIGEAGIGIYDTVDEAAVTIAGRVRENLKPLPADVITVQREKIKVEKKIVEEIVSVGEDVQIVFYSEDEGAELYLGGEMLIGTIEDGTLTYTGKANTTLEILIRKDHYHDHSQTFGVGEENADFTLERLFWKTKWDIGTQVMINQPLGLNATFRYHFIPDWLMLHTRIGGVFLPVTYLPDQTVLPEGFTISGDVQIGVGWYFLTPVRWPVRVYMFLSSRGAYTWSNNFVFPGVIEINFLGGGFGIELNFPHVIMHLAFSGYSPWGRAFIPGRREAYSNYRINPDQFYLYAGVRWKR